MESSPLNHHHEGELLRAILLHYHNGTLAQVFPLHREHIEALTDGSKRKESA